MDLKSVRKTFLLFFLTLLYPQTFISAQSFSESHMNDSLNNSILANYKEIIENNQLEQAIDSVRIVELEKEIQSLNPIDKIRKKELQIQIKILKNNQKIKSNQINISIDSLKNLAKGYPVKGFFNDTLFIVYNRLGSFTARERALAITKRIRDISKIFVFQSDPINIVETDNTVDVIIDEVIVVSITDKDAFWNNTTKLELAKKYKWILEKALNEYKAETSSLSIAKKIFFALISFLFTIILIKYSIKFFEWTSLRVHKQKGKRFNGIKINKFTLFNAHQHVQIMLLINKFVKWVVVLLIVYFSFPVIFSIFPWTKNIAHTLVSYILDPFKKIAIGLWEHLPNLITILVIIFIFHYTLKGVRYLKNEIEKGDLRIPSFYPEWANPTYQIIWTLSFAFMVVAIFPYLPKSDSPIFRGVSVFLGFLFTFGSVGSLSNIVAGFVLTYMRSFNIGDRVKIGETVGDIIEKSLLVTRIKTVKNEIISIPNATVMTSFTINYSKAALDNGLIIHTTVTLGYDVPWKKMHQALIDAALRTESILHDPMPFVLQTSLDDFYVSYQINAYTKEPNKQVEIYSMLHQNIQDICNERGIDIMAPHYRAVRDKKNNSSENTRSENPLDIPSNESLDEKPIDSPVDFSDDMADDFTDDILD